MNTSTDKLNKILKTNNNENKPLYRNWLGSNVFLCNGRIYAGYLSL